MCRICDGWQQDGGPDSRLGPETLEPRDDSGTDATLVAHGPQPYVFLESHWDDRPGRTFTWSNATLRLTRFQGTLQHGLGDAQQDVVRRAFAMWAAVANVGFREVADGDAVDIRVGLGAIDGPGGTAGHAPSWTEGGFRIRSNVVFDVADYPASGSVSLRVALHEIGHALGLGHSPVTGAIMYAFGNSSTTTLQPDDIAGIQALYGPSRAPLPRWPANETVDLGNLTNLTGGPRPFWLGEPSQRRDRSLPLHP